MLAESATLIAEFAVRTLIVTVHHFVRHCVILALHRSLRSGAKGRLFEIIECNIFLFQKKKHKRAFSFFGLNEAKPSSFLSRSFMLDTNTKPSRPSKETQL